MGLILSRTKAARRLFGLATKDNWMLLILRTGMMNLKICGSGLRRDKMILLPGSGTV